MIVVVGGALVDVRATTASRWVPDQSLPGVARMAAGGAARNVAVNLTRLGHRVTLLSAVGTDPLGGWLLETTQAAGVDVRAVRRIDGPTGLYVTVSRQGGPAWCVADARPIESLTPEDVAAWEPLVAKASVVVGDANLTDAATRALAALSAGRSRVLLTTSREKAPRLAGVLAGAAMLVGRMEEAAAMVAMPVEAAWQAVGDALVAAGIGRAVLTRGREGAGVVARGSAVWSPAVDVPLVDVTGAGDAVAAAAVHSLVRGLSPADTAALVTAAASVVVRSPDNTPAGLSEVLRSRN